MNKAPFSASEHPILRPLLLVAPGLVFLVGLALYGFPSVSWQILAIELITILAISKRSPLGLAAYFCLALLALIYLTSSTGRLGRETLILFPASTLIYHFYLLKKGGLPSLKVSGRDVLVVFMLLLWPLLFAQVEPRVASRPSLWLAIYFLLTLAWKIFLLRLGRERGRLEGRGAAEAMFILLSLGLGFVPYLTTLGVAFVGESRWWLALPALLFCLRLTVPKDLK